MRLDEIGLMHGTDKASNGHDYLKIYEEIMPYLRPVSLLEIGWFDGASMKTWRDYLHVESTIVGVDIDDKEPIKGVHFHRVNATTPRLLEEVGHYGKFDFIIDDGSHISADVIQTFMLLWGSVAPGGHYIIEDLHVSYHSTWKGWDPTMPQTGRKYGSQGSSMEYLKNLADAVHFGHAGAGPAKPLVKDVASLAFYPGLAILRKKP